MGMENLGENGLQSCGQGVLLSLSFGDVLAQGGVVSLDLGLGAGGTDDNGGAAFQTVDQDVCAGQTGLLGLSGMDKMAGIMADLRAKPPVEIGGYKVVKVTDYTKTEETGFPSANVLVYGLEGGATVIVRPSGTEPKIKAYYTTLGKTIAEAQAQKDTLAAALQPIFS